jgi:hypothetical protein
VSELDLAPPPRVVDRDRLAVGVPELIDKCPVVIENVDFAVAEISDQDLSAVLAKGERRPRHAPGRVEGSAAGEAPQQIAIGVENIDKAVARTRDVIVFWSVLLGVGDEQIAVDVLNAERRIPLGDVGIGKADGARKADSASVP